MRSLNRDYLRFCSFKLNLESYSSYAIPKANLEEIAWRTKIVIYGPEVDCDLEPPQSIEVFL